MSSNAFNDLDREYTQREDYLANRAEKRFLKKMTLTQFKIVLEKFMLARQKYHTTHTNAASKEWKAADVELALAYNRYMLEGRK